MAQKNTTFEPQGSEFRNVINTIEIGKKNIESSFEYKNLFTEFEKHKKSKDDVEYWSARELQDLLGYKEWRNFEKIIQKAVESCEKSNVKYQNHFVEVNKMVDLGSGSERSIQDFYLTRYACYLIAQNGDSKKKQIAFSQAYFAVQTRKYELIEKRLQDLERVDAREKLKESESRLSRISYQRGLKGEDFSLMRSEGDKALFG